MATCIMLLIDVFINIQHAEFHFVFTAAVFTVFTPETSLCTRTLITALHFLPNRSALLVNVKLHLLFPTVDRLECLKPLVEARAEQEWRQRTDTSAHHPHPPPTIAALDFLLQALQTGEWRRGERPGGSDGEEREAD